MTLKSGVYWRKSKLFGHLCPPGILALDGDQLSFTTATGRLFGGRASDIEASFSGWGTLTVRVDGASYDLVGTAGEMSTPFTPEQIAELQGSALSRSRAAEAAGDGLQLAGGAAAVLGELISVGVQSGKYASGVQILKQWPAVLAEAGAKVQAKSGNYMWWFFGGIGAALLIALVIGVIRNL
ncbi:hypothetical protein EYE40_07250 [Glaciihabitans arcticus]|uniref:Uncharacterized protein n=1 Tax=Glaciihabitans arcticus TaxID=2668039 RepID=A0A4Q9GY47_9MICO|nr:hypothetical protein [Glaciihabitans arcticus]TBN57210.1 hypothetical protein EYE40_07250 [Glaciihabitans arcticus]